MKPNKKTPCGNCQELQDKVDSLESRMEAMAAEFRCLQEQLAQARKDSSTSSKPPSSDIVKPSPPSAPAGKRSIGGQKGHPKHDRLPFPPEQVTCSSEHRLAACPCCSGPVRLNNTPPLIVQQIDINPTPLVIQQHTCPEYWCDHCARGFKAPLPFPVALGGLVGPDLTALIAYLKGACHASYSTVRTFLRDVLCITLSRSHLSNVLDKVSEALDQPYQELLDLLPSEAWLNVDETGHRCNKERWWTWCFRAELYVLYSIDPHRSADVLMNILGTEFQGVLGCDYFSAYRRYMRECDVTIQFCLAHLIRDVKFLMKLPDPRDQEYGRRLREGLKDLFGVIHQQEKYKPKAFEAELQAARLRLLQAGQHNVPPTRHGQNMGKRLREHGENYFTFITTPQVGPTNNKAEQAIRFVVIDRLITQGTRSEKGRRFNERIWTVIATCVEQGKSVHAYLQEVVRNHFSGEKPPSLLGKQQTTKPQEEGHGGRHEE